MITEDQKTVTAFLSDASSYGLEGPVEVMETHISRIFLVGDRAFKLKRAVRLPYVDFSTTALREAGCLKELELNARTTPELYLGVRRIYRATDGSLSFNPEGELIDAVVEMRRFGQECLLDRVAAAGELSAQFMTDIAHMVAEAHATSPVAHGEGGAANIAAVLDINKAGFATSMVFTKAEQKALDAVFRARLAQLAPHLDRRAEGGRIRLCHGDLHLRNLCLIDGAPRLFDCIDFNDRIATIDVLYDLAFLVMDLWHRDLRDHANLVANRYADVAGEAEGFALLPFFLALRAAVRAHVAATQAEEAGGDTRLAAAARSYYDLALAALEPQPARLIAIGGFSGSGKSTVADRLAPLVGAPPGARIVESDRVRKALHGVAAETHLGEDAYRASVSEMVYGDMVKAARSVLAAGGVVVADAVYDRPDRREALETAVAEVSVPFDGFWLDVPPETLRQRVASRRGGQSDATLAVLEKQLAGSAPASGWTLVDASRPPDGVIAEILTRLRGSR